MTGCGSPDRGDAGTIGRLEEWIRSNLDGRPDLIEKSIPDYPSSGKRILQDDGFWLRALRNQFDG